MESKKGYKLTEVGIIPEEWNVTTLSAISKQIGDGIHSTPNYVRSSDCFFVNGNNLANDRIVITDDTMRVSESEYLKLRKKLTGRTLLLSINGTIGNLAFYRYEKVVLGKSAAYINLTNKVSKEFVAYCLKYRPTTLYFENEVTGTTIRNLSLQSLRRTPLPLPNTETEQSAIADALSDADALLRSLDRLIAKKRDLKQAAMQQLLTGDTRLTGFDCEWKEKPFGELFAFSGGYSASRDQLSSEGHCYLHYGDIHGSTKVTVDATADYQIIPKLNVPLSRVGAKSMLEDGDVVFVDASEDDEGTSRHVVIVNRENIPFISGLHTIVAKSKTHELAHAYRRYCFQTAAIRQQFLFYAVGTKVTGISKTNIRRIKLSFPCVREQTAIAEVLIDIDEELMALETRRKKTRDLKKAMLQVLLTGKTRLV